MFGALALLLSSCSNDDNNSGSENKIVLVKKKIETDSQGAVTTFDYKYNGQKLISSVATSGDKVFYTYTDDLITKIEFKFDNINIQLNSFTYTSDRKLNSFTKVELLENYGYKEVYVYNPNGTITVQSYAGNASEQTTKVGSATITFANNEISEIVSTNSPNHKYVYDLKNNPFKNVTGLDKIAFTDREANSGVLYNLISDTSGTEVWSKYIYTYNAANYPTKSEKSNFGEKATVEFFY